MSEVGTIVEIEPEDGLGWIELANGDRVRFGGTACKGFVPAVGMPVEVVGTRPGYGGTVKATELRKAGDAPAAKLPTSAAAPGAPAAPAAAPQPRTGLHTIQQAGVRADDVLLGLIGRTDVDDAMHADLKAAHFTVNPRPGSTAGCKNPWLYVVADGAAGQAFGLYAHPMFEGQPLPYVLWSRERGTLRFVAVETADLLARVLGGAVSSGVDAAVVQRLQRDLAKLGMADLVPAALGEGEKAGWLPPDDAELASVDDYMAATDGMEMERGLLAHAYRRGDARAREALHGLYQSWGWSLPTSA